MIRKLITHTLAISFLAVGMGSAMAEDIDIFSTNTTVTPDAPNVLIIMDNTANWSQSFAGGTKFSSEKVALAAVVSALKTQFNLGLMMFTETGGGNSNTDGGYVRFAIQGMTDTTGAATAARNCLLKMVGGGTSCSGAGTTYYTDLDITADKSNGGKAGVTMGEAYDYFAGVDAYAGTNKVKADYTRAFTSGLITGPKYKSPVATSCQKNFIIVLSNGPFQDNASDTSTATSQLSAAGGSTTVINPPDNGSSNNNEGDEWVRFLNKVATVQAVTYTLEVGPSTTGQGPYNTSLLQSMGRQGKGGYYSAVDAATLLAALTRIFNDIQSVNSVFASASLPLSADNSGQFLDQVYMGVFRPDGLGLPRWVGNLKQYKFGLDTNSELVLVDSLGIAAAGSKGFAQPDSQSYWTSKDTSKAPDATASAATNATNGSTGGFYFFDSKGSGLTFDLADGDWVEKGGAAQQLRLAYLGYGNRGGIGDNNDSTLNSITGRQVLTCIGTCLTNSAGTVLTTAANRATTWFEVGNSAIDSAALGLNSTISVTSITNPGKSLTTLATGPAISTITVASGGGGGGKPVVVTTTLAHGFSNGDTVTVSGSSLAAFNKTATIASVTSTTFQFGWNLVGPLNATGGTAAKNTSTKAFVTATAHGLSTGQKVVISGATPTGFNNAAVATTTTVLDVDNFTYTLTAAQSGIATGTITYTGNGATATTATAHGYSNGTSVVIAGASPSAYNGTFTISNVGTTTFDYVFTGADPILTNATGTITVASTTGIRDLLVRWIRGLDTTNENGFQVNGANTDVRASIHGDVVHSRPVVLNFGTSATPNVYVFYGGNDGVFRAVKGGQAATDGNEQWAFVPQEFFSKFTRIYSNSPQVKYPSTPSGITPIPTKRDYFWDGPVGTYITRDSAGVINKAVLYLAARRGGRFIYALDVTAPAAPKFLWKKGCPNQTNDTGCDTGFAELGQTWSQPQVVSVSASVDPVLVFGAGYDSVSEDTDTPATVDTKGRGVYVLNALTGAPVWAAGKDTSKLPSGALQVSAMDFSVAADALLMDRTFDGLIDKAYLADVGGNIWRVDMSDAQTSNWRVWKIAAIGDTRPSATGTRKFYYAPDVVIGDTFDSIVIGSGDREHPLASSPSFNTVDRAYMFKDPNIGAVGADLGTGGNGLIEANLFDATTNSTIPSTANGWYITLRPGEKVINGALVAGGLMIFGTNQPDTSNSTCVANLGIARRYAIDYTSGTAGLFTDSSGNLVSNEIAPGGGLLPSPVAGVVQMVINGVTTPFTFVTDNPLSPGGVFSPPFSVSKKRFRTYWREILE